MSQIVIINGPPGVGKTTVARLLAHALAGTVCISGDDLRAFAPADARTHLGGGSTYRAAAALVNAYVDMGSPRVILDYVFLRPLHIERFLSGLDESIKRSVHIFTLWAPLDVIHGRECDRIGRSPLGPGVAESWHEINANRSELGEFLDTTVTAAEDTAQHLSVLLERRTARVSGPAGGASEQAGGADR